MDRNRVLDHLKLHEGLRLKPYKDTVGVLTIGYGRNLEKGISHAEAEYLLENDLDEAIRVAKQLVPSFLNLSSVRQEVLVEMAFNLGGPRLAGFKKMLAAIEAKDFTTASKEGRDSLWYQQVKGRGEKLMDALWLGRWD